METPDDRQPQHSVLIPRALVAATGRMARESTPFMKAPTSKPVSLVAISFLTLGGCGWFALAAPTLAQQVSREQLIGDLRLGQRIKVDDGTCPAGQVKEVSGAKMTSTGIVRAQKCIPRLGPKQR
jgi:hypothetical protein